MDMDTILVTVTVISLAIASVLGVLLWRTSREERRRSEARVNLLMDLAAPKAPRTERVRYADLDLRPTPQGSDAGTLFQARDEQTAWPRRLFAAGALAMAIGVAVLAWHTIGRMTPAARPAETVTQVRAPLELLSLAHQQQGDTFVVTGLVENPRGAAPLSNVLATVMVFGADGTLLASGRAPLDFTTLPPGGESPFVVRVPTTGASKYRVAFRDPHGEALAHIDRRSSDAVARKETP